jgi:hypothetical protein
MGASHIMYCGEPTLLKTMSAAVRAKLPLRTSFCSSCGDRRFCDTARRRARHSRSTMTTNEIGMSQPTISPARCAPGPATSRVAST